MLDHICSYDNKKDLKRNPVIYFEGSDTWRSMGIPIRNIRHCPHCGIRLFTLLEKSNWMKNQKEQAYFRSRMPNIEWNKSLLDEIIEILDDKKEHVIIKR